MASEAHSCPTCGTHLPVEKEAGDAQRRIQELEAEVERLRVKATAAVDKCADYEDQLRAFKLPNGGLPRSNTASSLVPDDQQQQQSADDRPSTANSASAKPSRFSFLRRGSPAQVLPFGHSPSTSDSQLLAQLEQERALRAKAEERARKVDTEIEELSVQLFSQANEMVAAERKARAKLEARVEQLEKKDKDKAARLERLEQAVTRIDRVKALLAAPTPGSIAARK
ncbi:hypothetical protein BS50DRAFT_495194 [Corynespora cassiicola Philippines]|uniref:GDP/GTP exchange factor Sec2 N-terminal domain-containing protein n=1 Tax=Corynespora cassiicola Philippines TaxID=1448308 RepID=A0A2T2NM35_CORCC|nr:hypothetical protein BS50DRAFT_495194 [Corynespora cassiicola Philippines]